MATSPLSYLFAKASSDPAAREDADEAVRVVGRFWIAVAALLVLILVVYGVGIAVRAW